MDNTDQTVISLDSAASPAQADDARWGPKPLLTILAIISALQLLFIAFGPIDLSGDEALYWEWSRNPDVNYYAKGPVVAYLIWLGTALLGHTPLGVRAPAVLISFLSSLVLYRLGSRICNRKVGFLSALLLQIVPVISLQSIGMTIDPPLFLLWLCSLLIFHRACGDNRRRDWLLLGVTIGVGLLTKYTMALFYVCALLYLLTDIQRRKILRQPMAYVAVLVSLLFLLPVIWWNYQHDWVNFRHNLGHTKIEQGANFSLASAGDYVGMQFLVVTPLLLPLILIAAVKRRRIDPLGFWFCVPVLGLFLLKSFQGKVEANWPAMAYLSALIPLSAHYLDRDAPLGKHERRFVTASLIIPLVATIMSHGLGLLTYVGFPAKWDPTAKLRCWKKLGQEVGLIYGQMSGPKFIFCNRDTLASELSFYMPGQPKAYCVNLQRRMNQYDIWPGFHDFVHQNAVFVSDDHYKMPDELREVFAGFRPVPLEIRDSTGKVMRTFYVYVCRDFSGMPKVTATRY